MIYKCVYLLVFLSIFLFTTTTSAITLPEVEQMKENAVAVWHDYTSFCSTHTCLGIRYATELMNYFMCAYHCYVHPNPIIKRDKADMAEIGMWVESAYNRVMDFIELNDGNKQKSPESN